MRGVFLAPPSLRTSERLAPIAPIDLLDVRGWGNAAPLAFLIALVVFQRRAYAEWRTSGEPLLARMICAGAAGMQGALPLLRRWLSRSPTP